MMKAPELPGLFYCLMPFLQLQYRQEVSMATVAENEKVKLELFKTILANPSNNLDGLNAKKAVETVEKMMQAIVDSKFGYNSKSKE